MGLCRWRLEAPAFAKATARQGGQKAAGRLRIFQSAVTLKGQYLHVADGSQEAGVD